MEEIVKKRQHYLPKAYMQFFARQERKAKKIHVYFRKESKHGYVSIDDICWRPYLYEQIVKGSGDTSLYAPNEIEDRFVELEGDYVSVVRRMRSDLEEKETIIISKDDQRILAWFIASLLFRHPFFVHISNFIAQRYWLNSPDIIWRFKERLKEVYVTEYSDELLAPAIAHGYLSSVLGINENGIHVNRMQQMLMHEQVYLLRAISAKFITSDTPVINFKGVFKERAYDFIGMPITPEVFLAFAEGEKEMPTVMNIEADLVAKLNNLQIRDTARFFFADSKDILPRVGFHEMKLNKGDINVSHDKLDKRTLNLFEDIITSYKY